MDTNFRLRSSLLHLEHLNIVQSWLKYYPFPSNIQTWLQLNKEWRSSHCLSQILNTKFLLSKKNKNKIKKKTSSVYDCTVEDVEYICNSNSTLCLFIFAIFVVLLLS